jgi:uncharacterized protein (TIGR03000 family)
MFVMRILAVGGILAVSSLFAGEMAAYGAPPSPTANDLPVVLTFVVPQNAEIWIEGTKTNSQGSVRQFVSPSLKSGQNYMYSIRVRLQRDGKDVDETRTLAVRGGDSVRVDFAGQSQGYAIAPLSTTGERSFYYAPDAEPRYAAPSNNAPQYYYSRPRSNNSFYGNTPGVGGPGTTW